jgi:hypothetical protein
MIPDEVRARVARYLFDQFADEDDLFYLREWEGDVDAILALLSAPSPEARRVIKPAACEPDSFTREEATAAVRAVEERRLSGEGRDWRGPCARYGDALERIAWPVEGVDTVGSLAKVARDALAEPTPAPPDMQPSNPSNRKCPRCGCYIDMCEFWGCEPDAPPTLPAGETEALRLAGRLREFADTFMSASESATGSFIVRDLRGAADLLSSLQ